MPLTEISFSNSAFSSAGEKAVERKRVFANVRVDAQADLGAGAGQVGEGGDRNGHVIADAAGLDDGLVRMLLDQNAAQQSNHS